MKKTINIHLGGMPFIIDEDAYNILHAYIESLRARFINENERTEIIADIEARIAEVFSSRLEKRQVVDETDVEFVIAQLGKPEDIAGNTEGEQTQSSATSQNRTYTQAGEKKLFRDPDNKLVGGVISGLTQYFGYTEAVWARLLFAIFLWFSFGTFLIVYLIFWLLVPKAKTAADKLQMRGEAVTLDNIQKEVQDTLNRANDVINRSVKDTNLAGKLATVLLILVNGLIKVIAAFVFVICIFILIAFLAAVFGFSILGLPEFAPLTQLFVDSHFTYIIALFAAILVVGIPLFSIMYSSAKFILSNKVESNKNVSLILTVLWIVSLLTLFIIGNNASKHFKHKETVREELPIAQPSGNTLYVASLAGIWEAPFFANNNIALNGIKTSENGFVFGISEFELQPSKDSLFHIERVLSAHGKDKEGARKSIQQINYRFSQSDSVISLNTDVEVFKKAKYRQQEVKNIIYIPVGKKLSFADENFIDFELNDETFYAGELPNKFFAVKDGKVVCENCDIADSTSKDEVVETHISVNGNGINIHANDSTNKVHIRISGNGINVNSKDKNGK